MIKNDIKRISDWKECCDQDSWGFRCVTTAFLDMGMIPGAEVTVVKFAPMGDPMELQVHGYELTLRLAEAEQIEVEEISERTNSHFRGERLKPVDHPGLGEEGKYHSEEDANPLPDGTVLTYALVGNQNCGKTTLFNQLTGANQHVGNFQE